MEIKSIGVKDSPFFEDFEIKFSSALNCIMGGRGTGKTTIIEFIKACIKKNVESDSYSYSLLKNNLEDGLITLVLRDRRDYEYRIEKFLNESPQIYKEGELVDVDEFLSSVQIDIYETNKIEEIGREPLNRLELIDKKGGNDIKNEINKIYNYQISLDNNANEIRDLRHKIELKKEDLRDFSDVDAMLKKHLENRPENLKDSEKEQFENADSNQKKRNYENRLVQEIDSIVGKTKNDIEQLLSKVESQFSFQRNENYTNKEIIDTIISNSESLKNLILVKSSEIKEEIEKFISSLDEQKKLLNEKHKDQEAKFIELKKKFDAHSSYLNTYNKFTTKIEQRDILKKDLNKLEKEYDKVISNRRQILSQFFQLKEKIFNKRLEIVNDLNKEFKGEIVLQLSFGGIKDDFESLLRQGLMGSGIHYNVLVPEIARSMSPTAFAIAINEKNHSAFREIRNIDTGRSESIINSFYNSDELFEIEKLYLPDRPDFLLKVIRDDSTGPTTYKNSEQLSMGQRCTTVLPIIFAISNNPLLIDQPEDNLDNEYITETIRNIITTQKNHRKLIFITNNPNIPVLSDAEFNIFFKFTNKSKIAKKGTIPEVKTNIIDLLEGGKEAFRKRKLIYGEE